MAIQSFFPLLIAGVSLSCAPAQVTPPVDDLGAPITVANRISYKTALAFGPARLDLLCWTTTAESGGSFFGMNLADGKVSIHPLNHLEAYPILFASDGRVYVGSTSGEVFAWEPVSDGWEAAGPPLFRYPGKSVNHVRSLCEGEGGWLYAGSVYGERARLNIRTRVVERLPAIGEPGEWYISAAATLPDGRIAFGCGHQARVFIYDPRSGRDVGQWLPDGWTKDGFCLNLVVGKRVLYATHFPSGRRGAFELTTGKFLGEIPWPPDSSGAPWSHWIHSSGYGSKLDFYLIPGSDAVVSYDGTVIHRFDPFDPAPVQTIEPSRFHPPPELALALRYDVSFDCRILEYDRSRTNVVRELHPEQPRVERGLFGLGVGPDGNVYGGAYQSTLLFQHDPVSGVTRILGDHHPGWQGETYTYAAVGGELICASYTNGAVVAYDPVRPWDCQEGKMVNPRVIGFLGQSLYRPYSICVTDDGIVWAVGPAGWGSTGGGVGRIDLRAKRIVTTPLPYAPVEVVPLSSGRLLLVADSLLTWWDEDSNRPLASSPSRLVLGGASTLSGSLRDTLLLLREKELVVAYCGTPGVVVEVKAIPLPMKGSRVIAAGRKAIVGGEEGIVSVDLQSGEIISLSRIPLVWRWTLTVADGWVYFANVARLCRVRIEDR